MSNPTPPRKFPPPCWTHDETLALIDSYRDRFLALRRGYLRTADWDSVANSVTESCRNLPVSTVKTSAQCRHKIEKLRQRYRAERQRGLGFTGKFFSSWIFFKHLDFIDGGDGSDLNQQTDANAKIGGAKGKNCDSVGGNISNVAPYSDDLDVVVVGGGDDDNYVKVLSDRDSKVFIGSKKYVNVNSNNDNILNNDGDYGVRGGLYVNSLGDRISVPPGFSAKKIEKMNANTSFDHENDIGLDVVDEFMGKNLGNHSSVPRANSYGKVSNDAKPYFRTDHVVHHHVVRDEGFRAKPSGNWNPKNLFNFNGDFNSKLDPSVHDGSSSRIKFAKNGGGATKREMDPIMEVVSSIKLLGEGFLKMEKMKMDMAMEIEKMRMDVEMKRNNTILESQRQIVDAFLKVYVEKNKKAKVTVNPES